MDHVGLRLILDVGGRRAQARGCAAASRSGGSTREESGQRRWRSDVWGVCSRLGAERFDGRCSRPRQRQRGSMSLARLGSSGDNLDTRRSRLGGFHLEPEFVLTARSCLSRRPPQQPGFELCGSCGGRRGVSSGWRVVVVGAGGGGLVVNPLGLALGALFTSAVPVHASRRRGAFYGAELFRLRGGEQAASSGGLRLLWPPAADSAHLDTSAQRTSRRTTTRRWARTWPCYRMSGCELLAGRLGMGAGWGTPSGAPRAGVRHPPGKRFAGKRRSAARGPTLAFLYDPAG
jgi:hypothetical protein